MELSNVSKTLFIPLWARAVETKKENPLIKDAIAVSILEKIPPELKDFKAKKSQIGVAIRSRILDDLTLDFIKYNPQAVIVNLGAGLDSRFNRIDNGKISWYNVDLPPVIELRKNLLPIENERVHNIPASILEENFCSKVIHKDLPVLLIMEGTSMYFTEEELKKLFSYLVKHFAPAKMFIEFTTKFVVKHGKHHDAVDVNASPFLYGIEKVQDVENLNPKIKLVAARGLFKGYRKYLGFFGILSFIPWVENNIDEKLLTLQIG